MDAPEKANDGKSNRVLFSGIAGDSMQQVVLCSDWCALEVLPNPSTHTEEHVIVVYPSTGKPSASKDASTVCAVRRVVISLREAGGMREDIPGLSVYLETKVEGDEAD